MKYFITVIFLMLGISSQAQTYKLYQTDNIHNQLRLNTKQVRYIKFKMTDKNLSLTML